MREILVDKQIITKDNDVCYFENSFKVKFGSEEVDKNISFLKNNIASLKVGIQNLDVEKKSKEVEEDLRFRFNVAKEALEDYNKYEEEIIQTQKDNKEEIKKRFLEYIEKFDDILKQQLVNIKKQTEDQKKMYQFQLENESKLLKMYEEAGYDVE